MNRFYKRFTMDTIWNCAFGIDIDIQNNPENEYFTKCEKVFSNTEQQNIFTFLASNNYTFKIAYLIIDILLNSIYLVHFHEIGSYIFNFMMLLFHVFGRLFDSFIPFAWIVQRVDEIVEKRKKEKVKLIVNKLTYR